MNLVQVIDWELQEIRLLLNTVNEPIKTQNEKGTHLEKEYLILFAVNNKHLNNTCKYETEQHANTGLETNFLTNCFSG